MAAKVEFSLFVILKHIVFVQMPVGAIEAFAGEAEFAPLAHFQPAATLYAARRPGD
jgi:hypothetical protein